MKTNDPSDTARRTPPDSSKRRTVNAVTRLRLHARSRRVRREPRGRPVHEPEGTRMLAAANGELGRRWRARLRENHAQPDREDAVRSNRARPGHLRVARPRERTKRRKP